MVDFAIHSATALAWGVETGVLEVNDFQGALTEENVEDPALLEAIDTYHLFDNDPKGRAHMRRTIAALLRVEQRSGLWKKVSPRLGSLHLPDVSYPPPKINPPRVAMATINAGMDFSPIHGGLEVFGGAIHWMGAANKVDEATLVAALEKSRGNRVEAGIEVGLMSTCIKSRIKRAKPDSPLKRFQKIKGSGGVRPTVDDIVLATLLEKHRGNRTRVAREVGLTRITISARVLRAAANSPIAPFKELRGKPRRPFVSEIMLALVLERHGGNRSRTAREVGVAPPTVGKWVEKAEEGSPLKAFQKPKRKRTGGGRKARFSDTTLAEILERHQGRRTTTAKELGVSPRSIYQQIKRAGEESPLKPFKTIKSRGKAAPTVDDVTLAGALERHEGNQTRAGQEVGLSNSSVNQRIRRARPDSPLRRFQEIKGKGGVASKIDDATLAEALRRHGGNIRKTGEEVGLSRSTIEQRVDRSQEDSPLYSFQGTRSRIKVKDDALAQALERHGGNRTQAGKEVGLSLTQAAKRVRNAKPDSPLYRFKEMKRGKKKEVVVKETQPKISKPAEAKPKKEKTLKPPKKIQRGRQLISLRVESAPDASPIARIAKKRVSDSTMAEVLRSHGGSISVAAKTLGLDPQVIRARLEILTKHSDWLESSPLKAFVFLVGD